MVLGQGAREKWQCTFYFYAVPVKDLVKYVTRELTFTTYVV
jgi:hypothetical protein